jgi:hypothetical protein
VQDAPDERQKAQRGDDSKRCKLKDEGLRRIAHNPEVVRTLTAFVQTVVWLRWCCLRALTVLKLQRDEAHQQCRWIELADDRFHGVAAATPAWNGMKHHYFAVGDEVSIADLLI